MHIQFTETTANRLKGHCLSTSIHPQDAFEAVDRAWDSALSTHGDQAFVQLRCVIPLRQEDEIIRLNTRASSSDAESSIAGRIPFLHANEAFGLYYLHRASIQRPSIKIDSPIQTHQQALYAANKTRKVRPLDQEFQTHVVQFNGSVAFDALTDRQIPFLDRESTVEQIQQLHRFSFDHPHDTSQRDQVGINKILDHNPVVLAAAASQIAAVGFIEQESQPMLGTVHLSEPTYFTHPEYRSRGLSYHLRQATKVWINTQPNHICFAESVRYSSFPLSIGSGFRLAGTPDSAIQGNLGDAYTYIGPANPQTGYMPMGLSYFESPAIRFQAST